MGYDVTVGAGQVGGASLNSNADVASMYASLLSQLQSGVPMEEIQKGLRKPTGKGDLDSVLKQIADAGNGGNKSGFMASLITNVGGAVAQSYMGGGATQAASLQSAAQKWGTAQGIGAPTAVATPGATLEHQAGARQVAAAADLAARSNVLAGGNLALLLGAAVAKNAADIKGGGRAGQGWAAAAAGLGTMFAINQNTAAQGGGLPSAADLTAPAAANAGPAAERIEAGTNISMRRAEIGATGASMKAEAVQEHALAKRNLAAAQTPDERTVASAQVDRAKAKGDYGDALTSISQGWMKVSDANATKLSDASARYGAANAVLGGGVPAAAAPAPAAVGAPAAAAIAAPAAVVAAGAAAAPAAVGTAAAPAAAARARVAVSSGPSTNASSSAEAALAKAKAAEPDYDAIKLGKVTPEQQSAAQKAAEAAKTELGAAKADISKQKLQVDAQIASLKAQPSMTSAEKKLVGALEGQSKYLGDVGAHVQARMDSLASVNEKLSDGKVGVRENLSMGTERVQVGVRGNQLREQGPDIDAAVAAAFADVTKERAVRAPTLEEVRRVRG